MFLGYKQRKNTPRARLPLGGKVSPSECDGRRMRGNVQFLSVKQFDKPKVEIKKGLLTPLWEVLFDSREHPQPPQSLGNLGAHPFVGLCQGKSDLLRAEPQQLHARLDGDLGVDAQDVHIQLFPVAA